MADERRAQIAARLAELIAAADAESALLATEDGRVLGAAGVAAAEPVAGVAAGTFGVARALGAALGAPECLVTLHLGPERSAWLVPVAPGAVLTLVVAATATPGRALAGAAADLGALLATLPADAAARAALQSARFRASFDDALERLFHDDAPAGAGER